MTDNNSLIERAYGPEAVEMQEFSRKTICSEQDVLTAIENTGGILTDIARKLGVTPNTVASYRRRWPSVAMAIDQEKETRKDFVENMLFRHIEEGSLIGTMFYLKTQAKDRGYVEASTNVISLVKEELMRYIVHLQERLEPEVFEAVVNATREFKTIEGTVVTGGDL